MKKIANDLKTKLYSVTDFDRPCVDPPTFYSDKFIDRAQALTDMAKLITKRVSQAPETEFRVGATPGRLRDRFMGTHCLSGGGKTTFLQQCVKELRKRKDLAPRDYPGLFDEMVHIYITFGRSQSYNSDIEPEKSMTTSVTLRLLHAYEHFAFCVCVDFGSLCENLFCVPLSDENQNLMKVAKGVLAGTR